MSDTIEEKKVNLNFLTDKERKHLKFVLSFHQKSGRIFFVSGVCFTVALWGLILGLFTGSPDSFKLALFFGFISLFILVCTMREKKLIDIIKKLIAESDLK